MNRPTRRPVVLTGVAVLALAAAVTVPVLAGGDGGAPAARPRLGAMSLRSFEPTTHLDRLAVHDGDLVRGQGQVLALPGRPVRFCAPVPNNLMGDPRYRPCPIGLDATGVDLDRLSGRSVRKRDGAVTGSATLVGTYRHGRLTVSSQSAPSKRMYDELPKPPCAPPDGGWPRGRRFENLDMEAVQHYRHAHPDTVLDIANLRASDRQVVAYVVTLRDPATVRTALRSAYGDRLCVMRSRWSRAQLTHALDAVNALDESSATPLFRPTGTGRSLGAHAQPQVFADMLLVTPSVARRLGRLPDGIVSANAWLTPR